MSDIDKQIDIQAFLENICRGNYDENGVCLWDLAELRDGIETIISTAVKEARIDEAELAKTNWECSINDSDFYIKMGNRLAQLKEEK